MSSQKHNGKNGWHEGESSSGEGVGSTKPPFSKRLKRNCAKWWWLYLLALIIVVIVVVIPIIFVGIRNIAQSTLDKATVDVDLQVMTNPGPTSFALQLNTTVHGDDSHKATVENFNASFYLLDRKDTPFIYVDFPSVESAAVSQVNLYQSNVTIANMESFIAYNTLVLNSEEFEIGVRGNTHVVLNGLPKYSVTYDKTTKMKGFNKFSGFHIDSIQFHIPAESDGATMTGKVSIPNPSIISAQFGNVTMGLYTTNGTYLGYSLLEYVEYKPGNNTYDMRSYIDTTLALAYTQDYVLDMVIKGNSSVNIGGEHLVYFEEALKTNPINYRLNITEATSSGS